MIQASELRIGNHINTPDGIGIVDGLATYYKKPVISVAGDSYIQQSVSGIPLTEELLLKMGFEKNVETDTWFLHIKQPISKHNFSLIQVSLLVTNGTYFDVYIDNNFTMICEFVHDLQNIVYMLGKKELTLS